MTTSPVPSITDEQIAEIENYVNLYADPVIPPQVSYAEIAALIARLRAAEKELSLWVPIMNEVHRRADKECCLQDRCDFTLTVMHDDYAAIDQAMTEAKP